jgi:hypothetical protein
MARSGDAELMWPLPELSRLFKNQPWQNRVAYSLMLLLAVLYLLTQIAMAVMWLAGEAQIDAL